MFSSEYLTIAPKVSKIVRFNNSDSRYLDTLFEYVKRRQECVRTQGSKESAATANFQVHI